ncbi:MAG: DinB family protein [Actinomycetota bacterium]
MDVYVERGSRRTFASAVDWPGYARVGRDERSALENLAAYGPRYARVVSRSRLGFRPPRDADDLVVVRRIAGTGGTDFGVPEVAAPDDAEPIEEAELKRLISLLRASWRALDGAAGSARDTTLAKGPRGGGRSLEAILDHVRDAEGGYLTRLAWKTPPGADAQVVRAAVVDALTSAVRDGVEERGPRGGKRWVPRYFVRRVAWHALDHAWEIEDRSA